MSGSIYLSIYLNLWPHCKSCGIFVPGTGIEPTPSALAVQSLNHWTAREVPGLFCLLGVEKAYRTDACLIVIPPSVSKHGTVIFRAPSITQNTRVPEDITWAKLAWDTCAWVVARQIPWPLSGLPGQGQSHSQSFSLEADGGQGVGQRGLCWCPVLPGHPQLCCSEKSPQGTKSQFPHLLNDILLLVQLGDSMSQQT